MERSNYLTFHLKSLKRTECCKLGCSQIIYSSSKLKDSKIAKSNSSETVLAVSLRWGEKVEARAVNSNKQRKICRSFCVRKTEVKTKISTVCGSILAPNQFCSPLVCFQISFFLRDASGC